MLCENCWVQYSNLCSLNIAISWVFFTYFNPETLSLVLGLNVARKFPGLEMLRHQSCVFSSGFLLYRWDFVWDSARE